MLKLFLLISLLSFVLESFLNSHCLEWLFMFILLFFVEYCLWKLISYVILKFRIGTLLCLCRYVSLYCLFLLSFVIYENYFIALNFKYLFHVLLLSWLNFVHVKLFHLLQEQYFLGLNELVKWIHSRFIMALIALDYFVLINQKNLFT